MVDLKMAEKTEQSQRIGLLTIREVAEALQCSERAVWGWTKDGELPVVRFGRVRRYRPEDVKEFVAKHLSRRTPQKNP